MGAGSRAGGGGDNSPPPSPPTIRDRTPQSSSALPLSSATAPAKRGKKLLTTKLEDVTQTPSSNFKAPLSTAPAAATLQWTPPQQPVRHAEPAPQLAEMTVQLSSAASLRAPRPRPSSASPRPSHGFASAHHPCPTPLSRRPAAAARASAASPLAGASANDGDREQSTPLDQVPPVERGKELLTKLEGAVQRSEDLKLDISTPKLKAPRSTAAATPDGPPQRPLPRAEPAQQAKMPQWVSVPLSPVPSSSTPRCLPRPAPSSTPSSAPPSKRSKVRRSRLKSC